MDDQFKRFWAPFASIVGAVLLVFQLAQAFTGNRTLITGLLIMISFIAIGIGTWNYAFAKSSIEGIPRYSFHWLAKIALVLILVSIMISVIYNLTILGALPDCCAFVVTKTSTPTATVTPSITPTITPGVDALSQFLTATPTSMTTATLTPTTSPMPTDEGGGPGHIVFSAKDGDGDLEIYFLDIFRPDPNPIQLTNNAVPDLDPIWSPDGSKIAFVSYRDGNPDIFIMNSDGSNPQNITKSASEDYSPAWSPDGQKIVFSTNIGNTEIYKININASNLVPLTNINSVDAEPSVSVSATTGLNVVVFRSNRNNASFSELFTMLLDGSQVKKFMPNRRQQWDTSPSFSPDGTKVAFVSSEFGKNEIFVVNSDGTNLQQLTFSTSVNEYSPSWSPDGLQIIFVTGTDGDNIIYRMNMDGSNIVQIMRMEDANYPSWRP